MTTLGLSAFPHHAQCPGTDGAGCWFSHSTMLDASANVSIRGSRILAAIRHRSSTWSRHCSVVRTQWSGRNRLRIAGLFRVSASSTACGGSWSASSKRPSPSSFTDMPAARAARSASAALISVPSNPMRIARILPKESATLRASEGCWLNIRSRWNRSRHRGHRGHRHPYAPYGPDGPRFRSPF
jgi:hypothetical protein